MSTSVKVAGPPQPKGAAAWRERRRQMLEDYEETKKMRNVPSSAQGPQVTSVLSRPPRYV